MPILAKCTLLLVYIELCNFALRIFIYHAKLRFKKLQNCFVKYNLIIIKSWPWSICAEIVLHLETLEYLLLWILE